MASRVLGEEACKKIDDGDAIMTYGMSAVVLNILLLAHSVRFDRFPKLCLLNGLVSSNGLGGTTGYGQSAVVLNILLLE